MRSYRNDHHSLYEFIWTWGSAFSHDRNGRREVSKGGTLFSNDIHLIDWDFMHVDLDRFHF